MRAKVYRNIDRRQEWFGVEVLDAFALGFLGAVMMLLYPQAVGWDVLVFVLAWAALRYFKRGKPTGYLQTLLRFYFMRPAFLSAAARDREAPRHPLLRARLLRTSQAPPALAGLRTVSPVYGALVDRPRNRVATAVRS